MSKRISGLLNRGYKSLCSMKAAVPALAVASTLAVVSAASAQGAELPDTGVDMEDLLGLAITGLGAIVVVVVGGYLAFKLIKLALRWVGKIGG